MAQNEYLVDSADMTTVADAIREKGGTTAPLSFPAGMVEAVRNIPSGGDKPLVVTFTLIGVSPYLLKADTPYDDIKEAANAGRIVYAFVPNPGPVFGQLTNASSSALQFNAFNVAGQIMNITMQSDSNIVWTFIDTLYRSSDVVGGGDFDADNHKITYVKEPTDDSDAATKGYVDKILAAEQGEAWELIASGEMQEAALLNITKDNNGLPFSLKSAQIFVRGDISIPKSSSMRVSAERFGSVKDYDSYSIEVLFGKDNPKVNLWYVLCEKTMPMLFWELAGIDWQSTDCKVLMGVHKYHMETEDVTENVYGKDPLNHVINKVSIGQYMGTGNMAAGCKYEIWGVRA